jgi:hypothetical protein
MSAVEKKKKTAAKALTEVNTTISCKLLGVKDQGNAMKVMGVTAKDLNEIFVKVDVMGKYTDELAQLLPVIPDKVKFLFMMNGFAICFQAYMRSITIEQRLNLFAKVMEGKKNG